MPLEEIKVLFMGTPHFAIPSLQALIDSGVSIIGVVTQPDRPKGRGKKLIPSPVKELALREGLPLFQPEKVRDDTFVESLKTLSPDVVVVVAFGQILPVSILEIPPMGCVNVHSSLLPKYRGAAPINWAVVKGEDVTGVTTMFMDEGLDTGDMLLKEELNIAPEDDAQSIYSKLAEMGGRLIVETIMGLKKGTVLPEKQDDACASLAPILKKEDGVIEWSRDAVDIVNLVRGMLPWPTAQTTLKGKALKVFSAGAMEGEGHPGVVLRVEKDALVVAAGKGAVAIYELQMEGKKRMDTGGFLRGCPVKRGEVLGN